MNEASKPLPSTPSKGRVPQSGSQDIPSNETYHSTDTKEMKQNKPNREINNMFPKRSNVSSQEKSNNNNTVSKDESDEEFEFFHEFKREKVKDVIHHITSFLKQNAMDVEYLMIPFRPEQSNEKLLKFLNAIFPLGNGQPINEKAQMKIISKTDVWTLFQSLKYIWCRLPNSEIVGWKAYFKFKYKEIEKNYPQKAFLEIMPQCLESPNHASIVYDFFDLIVTLSSNSRVNKMSARKVSKMCALWAFKKSNVSNINNNDTDDNEDDAGIMDINDKNSNESPSYDFDANNPRFGKINNSFQDGLNEWIPASDAMFHLLLSFLKSFVPRDLESSKLPKSLKSILFNNEYPPKGSTAYTSQTILTIPLVTLYTDKFSRKPWQLLERCNDLLDFSNHDAFEAREDYALLKSLFMKKNNVEGISRKMSQESRRLMKIMSTKHSTFQAGWAPRRCVNNIYDLKENIQIQRVDIDDYFIWTWLSSLSYEETSEKKKIFGRSLILEFEFDGFKKWVIFEECDITLHYKSISQLKKKQLKEKKDYNASVPKNSRKDKPLPDVRNTAPIYEKFQKDVPSQSVSKVNHSVLNSPSLTPQGQYHTIIDRPLSNKNHKPNLHALEEKISKWNPLHNLRKKSNSIASEKSGSTSSSEIKKEFASSSVYDSSQSKTTTIEVHTEQSSNDVESKSKARVISQYSLLDPQKYKLPEIEKDEEGFNIDLSNISNNILEVPSSKDELTTNEFSPSQKSTEGLDILDSQTQKAQRNNQLDLRNEERYHINNIPTKENRISPKLQKTSEHAHTDHIPIADHAETSTGHKERHSAAETLEELSDMVEDMMSQDEVAKVEAARTFEEMTKFDKYKPKDFDEESSTSSAVPSLRINATIDEKQTTSHSSKVNIKNTNYRQRINFNTHLEGTENQDFNNSQYSTANINEYRKNNKTTPQSNNISVYKSDPQDVQINDISRVNQYIAEQQENVSPNYDLETYPPKKSLEQGRRPQQIQEKPNYNKSPVNIQQNYPEPTYERVSPTHQNDSHIVPNQASPIHSPQYNPRTIINNNASNSPAQDRIYQQQWTNNASSRNSISPIIVKPQSQPPVPVQPQVSPQPYTVQTNPTMSFNNKQYQEHESMYTTEHNDMYTAPRYGGNNNIMNGNLNNNYNAKGPQGKRYQQVSSKYTPDNSPSVQRPIFAQGNMNKIQTPINNNNHSFPPAMINKMAVKEPSPNFNGRSPSPHMQHDVYDNRERMQMSPIPKQYHPQTQGYTMPVPVNNGMKPSMYPPTQQQFPYHHPNHLPVQNLNAPMNPNRSPQLDGYSNYVHPMYGNNYSNGNDNGSNVRGPMIPSDIPVAVTHNTIGMKLHGNNINKKQERKQLYNNSRSGNFGI